MNKNCGIYKITSPTGRVYIGQSVNLKRRLREYLLESKAKEQPRINKSLLKYGAENHQFDIIEYCSEEELNCSERFWQDEFDVLGINGLNCLLVECGEKRKINSEETTKKLSRATSGENNPNYGKKWSDEHKKKLSDLRKQRGLSEGKNNPMYGKKGKLNPNFGKKRPKEFGENISRRQTGVDNHNARLVLHETTGVFFETLREAAETYGYNRYTLANRLRGLLKNNTDLTYV